jgi:hypothetical protein
MGWKEAVGGTGTGKYRTGEDGGVIGDVDVGSFAGDLVPNA